MLTMKRYLSPDGSSNDCLFHFPASPDCEFDENMCNWDAEQGWILKIPVEGFEASGKLLSMYAVYLSQLYYCNYMFFQLIHLKGVLVIKYER